MRWMLYLLTALLSGCQALPVFERPIENEFPIMPLWERYQRCLVTTDPTELLLIIDQFERVMPAGAEPPSWMRVWGDHVMSQPLRMSVDPRALGAACTLRAAGVMAAMNHPAQARILYQRVLTRYAHDEGVYYVHRAQEELASLSGSSPAVVAFRLDRTMPR